jgi:hypothetical protein
LTVQNTFNRKGLFAAIPVPEASSDGLMPAVQALKINVEQLIGTRGTPHSTSVLVGDLTGPPNIVQTTLKGDAGPAGPPGPPGPSGAKGDPGVGFPDAPNDTKFYGRHTLAWAKVTEEAPTDGSVYGRQNGTWQVVTSGGGGGTVAEAPNDGSLYGRKSLGWQHVTHTDITDWTATLAPYALSSSVPTPYATNPAMDGTAAPGSSALYSRGDHVHPTDTSRYAASNPSGYQTAAQVTAALGPYALTSAVPVASSTTPVMDSTAAVGTGTTWARADHVHPSDTSRAPVASPTFTGTVTMFAWQFGNSYIQFTQGGTSTFRFASGGVTQNLIFNNSNQGPALKIIDPTTGSATPANYLQIHNATTGNPALIDTAGADTNRSIQITPAGTGTVNVGGVLNGTSVTLTDGIGFGSTLAPGGAGDLSKHIALFGTSYGLNITSSRLNIVSPTSVVITSGTNDTISVSAGTMNFDSTANVTFSLRKNASGNGNFINAYTGIGAAALRWQMVLGNGTAEGGSNAGSDFELRNYDDTGVQITVPVLITRSTGAVRIRGTNTNDNTAAGFYGEVISSNVTTGVTLTSTTAVNITSISLTAGDWDVEGEIWISVGAGGATAIHGGIGPTSAGLPPASAVGTSRYILNSTIPASVNHVFPLRTARISLATTTIYYLITSATFPSGTVTATGNIIARRMR